MTEPKLELDELLTSPIPVLSNRALVQMMDAGLITIHDFDHKRLGPTAYQLCPDTVRFRNEDEDGLGPDERSFRLFPGSPRRVRPGEHVIFSPKEVITLTEGFVADFYASSWCVDRRVILTAGRLDAHYSRELVFGLFNAGRLDVEIACDTQIARATFGWLGPTNKPQYKGEVPGAYMPQLLRLRKEEEDLADREAEIRRRREQIEKSKIELMQRSK